MPYRLFFLGANLVDDLVTEFAHDGFSSIRAVQEYLRGVSDTEWVYSGSRKELAEETRRLTDARKGDDVVVRFEINRHAVEVAYRIEWNSAGGYSIVGYFWLKWEE